MDEGACRGKIGLEEGHHNHTAVRDEGLFLFSSAGSTRQKGPHFLFLLLSATWSLPLFYHMSV